MAYWLGTLAAPLYAAQRPTCAAQCPAASLRTPSAPACCPAPHGASVHAQRARTPARSPAPTAPLRAPMRILHNTRAAALVSRLALPESQKSHFPSLELEFSPL